MASYFFLKYMELKKTQNDLKNDLIMNRFHLQKNLEKRFALHKNPTETKRKMYEKDEGHTFIKKRYASFPRLSFPWPHHFRFDLGKIKTQFPFLLSHDN